MKFLFIAAAAWCLVPSAFAGAETIVRERAKELRDQNNVRQGVAPAGTQPAKPITPAATTPTPATAAPQTPLQRSIARVQADLAAIKVGTPVTAGQQQQLATDLLSCVQGPVKPSTTAVAKLSADLCAVLAEKSLSTQDRNRLLSDLNAVLNPASIQPAQMQAIIADVQAILQANGVTRSKAVVVADDVKALAAETQKGAAR